MCNFVINLGELFSDFRKKCIIHLDDTFKTIADVECYLKDKFQIEIAFYLESSDVWIPSFSKIDILNSLDEVRLRLVQPQPEIGTGKHEKKKKKKRKHLYEPELQPIESDNIEEEDRSKTHVKQKKKKKREDQIDTDVSSLTFEEDGKITKKKKNKKGKDRNNGSSESEKVETSIPKDITKLLGDAELQTPAGNSSITLQNPTISNDFSGETSNIQTESASSSNILDNPTTSNDVSGETSNIQTEYARSSDILSNPSTSYDFTDKATNIQTQSASSSNILNNSTISNDSANTAKRKRIRKRKKRSDKNVAMADSDLEKAKEQAISIINSRLDYWQPNQQVAAKRTHIRFDEEEEEEGEEEEEMSETTTTEIPTSAPTVSSEESSDVATSIMTANSLSNPQTSKSEYIKTRYENFEKTVKMRKLQSSPSVSNVGRCSDETAINKPSTSKVIGSRNESVMNTGILSHKVESEPPKGGYKVPVYYRKPFSNHTVLISTGVDQSKTEVTPISKSGLPKTHVNVLENSSNSGDKLVIESGIITDECSDSVAVSGDTDNVNKNREDVEGDTVKSGEPIEEILKTIADIPDTVKKIINDRDIMVNGEDIKVISKAFVIIFGTVRKFQNGGYTGTVMNGEEIKENLKNIANICDTVQKLLNDGGTVMNGEDMKEILKIIADICDIFQKIQNKGDTVKSDEAIKIISKTIADISDTLQKIQNERHTVMNGEARIKTIIADILATIQKAQNVGAGKTNTKETSNIHEVSVNNADEEVKEEEKESVGRENVIEKLETDTANYENGDSEERQGKDDSNNENGDKELRTDTANYENGDSEERQGKDDSNNENGDKELRTDTANYENGDNEDDRSNEGNKYDRVDQGKEGRIDNKSACNVGFEEKGTGGEKMENRGNVRKNTKKEESNYRSERSAALAVFPLLSKPVTTSSRRIPEAKPKPHKALTIPEPDFSAGDIISFQVMYINSRAMPVATEEIMGQILSIKKKFKIEVLCGTVKVGSERTRLSNLEDGEDELKVYLPGSTVELFLNEMIGPKKVEKALLKKQV